jgi:hypothetical protein
MSQDFTSEPNGPKPFSDQLMEAATRAHELPREEIARLLLKAAIRLRVVQQTGVKLEHIPVSAYHLLRRISRGPVKATTRLGDEERDAVTFLLSRDLIARSEDGAVFEITAAGEELGEIADERNQLPGHP